MQEKQFSQPCSQILSSLSVLLDDAPDGMTLFPALLSLFRILSGQKNGGDTYAQLNHIASLIPPGRSFVAMYDQELFQILGHLTAGMPRGTLTKSAEESDAAFFYNHACTLTKLLSDFIPLWLKEVKEDQLLPRLRPSTAKLNTEHSAFLRMAPAAVEMELNRRNAPSDAFSGSRIFLHRNGKFIPAKLDSVKRIEDFYGYREARETFLEHFGAFAAGRTNLPFLISSLPGLGKTQMTVSYTLHFPELTLILPEPHDLSGGLEDLIRPLANVPAKKFMLFFDDIDVEGTDWYYFRTNIGGLFSLPSNISVVIASNHRFPASISSRGRGFEFPIFDEVRCQEMVADFLIANGMKSPAPELVAVIASDYVEDFGQKKFEELSPRTLSRYLSSYGSDPAKRKSMMDKSCAELIPQPDAQVFYDENLKLMRTIYGDSILEELREKAFHGS